MGELVAYVDESGGGPGAHRGRERVVLACIAGSAGALDDLAERIRRLKLELVPGADPADWELHAVDMFHGRGGSPLGSLGMERKMCIMRRIVDAVCDSDVVLFGIVVTGGRTRGKRATGARAVGRATALLVERLATIAEEAGGGTTLRIVSDNMHEGNRLAMEGALERYGKGRVTGIEFVDSRSSAMVQVADALAYVVTRHMGGDAAFGEMFRDIERKAQRHRGHGGIRVEESGRRTESTRYRRP